MSRRANKYVVEVQDALSPLRQVEVSVDAGDWRQLGPTDGMIDGLSETFEIDAATDRKLPARISTKMMVCGFLSQAKLNPRLASIRSNSSGLESEIDKVVGFAAGANYYQQNYDDYRNSLDGAGNQRRDPVSGGSVFGQYSFQNMETE